VRGIRIFSILFASAIMVFAVGGCASITRQLETEESDFKTRAISDTDGGVRASCSPTLIA